MKGERKIQLSTKVTNQILKKTQRYSLSYKSYKALRLEVLRKCYKDPETDVDFVIDLNSIKKINEQLDKDWTLDNLEFEDSEEDLRSLETTRKQSKKTLSNSKSCKPKSKNASKSVLKRVKEVEEDENSDDQESDAQENENEALDDSEGNSSSSETTYKQSKRSKSKSFKKTTKLTSKNASKSAPKRIKEVEENKNGDDQESSDQENTYQSLDLVEQDSASEADYVQPSFMGDIAHEESIDGDSNFKRNWETTCNTTVSETPSRRNVSLRGRVTRSKTQKKLDLKRLLPRKNQDSPTKSKQKKNEKQTVNDPSTDDHASTSKTKQKNLIVNYFKPVTKTKSKKIPTGKNDQSVDENIPSVSEEIEKSEISRVDDSYEDEETSSNGKNGNSERAESLQEEEICPGSETEEYSELNDKQEENLRDQCMSPEIPVCTGLVVEDVASFSQHKDKETLEKRKTSKKRNSESEEKVELMEFEEAEDSQDGSSLEKEKVCSNFESEKNASGKNVGDQETTKERTVDLDSELGELAELVGNKAEEESRDEFYLAGEKLPKNLVTEECVGSSQNQDQEEFVGNEDGDENSLEETRKSKNLVTEECVDSSQNQDGENLVNQKILKKRKADSDLETEEKSELVGNEDGEDSVDKHCTEETKVPESLCSQKTPKKGKVDLDSKPEEKSEFVGNENGEDSGDENSPEETRVPEDMDEEKTLKEQKVTPNLEYKEKETPKVHNSFEESMKDLENGTMVSVKEEEVDISDVSFTSEVGVQDTYDQSQAYNFETQFDENKEDEDSESMDSDSGKLVIDETQVNDSFASSVSYSNIESQVPAAEKKEGKEDSSDSSYVLSSQIPDSTKSPRKDNRSKAITSPKKTEDVTKADAQEEIPIMQNKYFQEMEADSADMEVLVPDTQEMEEDEQEERETENVEVIPETLDNEDSLPKKGAVILKYEVLNQHFKILKTNKNRCEPALLDEQSLDEGIGKSESPSSSCTREKKSDLDFEDFSRDGSEEENLENKGYITSRCDYGGDSGKDGNPEKKEAKKLKKKKNFRIDSDSDEDGKKSKKKKKKKDKEAEEIPSTPGEEKSKKKKKKKRDDPEAKEEEISDNQELKTKKKKKRMVLLESEEDEELKEKEEEIPTVEEVKKSKKKKKNRESKENEESLKLVLDETKMEDESPENVETPRKKKSKKTKTVESIEIEEEEKQDEVEDDVTTNDRNDRVNDNLVLEDQEQNDLDEDNLPAEKLKPMKRLDLFSQNFDDSDSDFPEAPPIKEKEPKPKEKKSKKKRKDSVVLEEEKADLASIKPDLAEKELEKVEKKSRKSKKAKSSEEVIKVESPEKKSKKQKKIKADPIETHDVPDSELENNRKKKKKKTHVENVETEIFNEAPTREEKKTIIEKDEDIDEKVPVIGNCSRIDFFSQHDSGSENENENNSHIKLVLEESKILESAKREEKKKSKKRKREELDKLDSELEVCEEMPKKKKKKKDKERSEENQRKSILSGSLGNFKKSPKKSGESKEEGLKLKSEMSMSFNSEEEIQTPLAHSTCIVANPKFDDEKAKSNKKSKPKMKKLHSSTSSILDLQFASEPATSEENQAKPEAPKKKKKMSKILDLVERDELIEDERKCSFFMQSIEPEDEVYVLEMPQKIVSKDLVGKKITIDSESGMIQVDQMQYKTRNQSSSTFSCASKLSNRHKKFAMTIIKPVANIVFKEKVEVPTTESKPHKKKSTKNREHKIKKLKVENIPNLGESEDEFISTKIVTTKPVKPTKKHKISSKLKTDDFVRKESSKKPKSDKIKSVHVC